MGSGSVLPGRRPAIARLLAVAALLAALLALPAAGAHGLISLSVVVPDQCPDDGACLQTIEHQPRLHAGETVDVNVYNDDDETHEILVTTETQADPARANTSEASSLVTGSPLSSNASASLESLTIPPEAGALYVWCGIDDHEAEGERLVVDVEPAHAEADGRLVPGLTLGGAGLAVLAALGWNRRRR